MNVMTLQTSLYRRATKTKQKTNQKKQIKTKQKKKQQQKKRPPLLNPALLQKSGLAVPLFICFRLYLMAQIDDMNKPPLCIIYLLRLLF